MSISFVPIETFGFATTHVTTFDVPQYKTGVLIVTGSAACRDGHGATNGAVIGFVVNLNGTAIGNCQVWASMAGIHITLPTFFARVALQEGTNSITISALDPVNTTSIDENDQFKIYFME